MADDHRRSAQTAGLTGAKPPPAPRLRYIWPAIAVLVVIIGGLAGYMVWSRGHAAKLAESVGDPGLARPDPAECAIVQSVLGAAHAAGDDKRWLGAGPGLTLRAHSRVVNPVDVAGYADDEADNLRSKLPADWRWCAGIGAFVRGLGWSAMGGDADVAQLGLARPAMNTAGDEAKVYETMSPPAAEGEAPRARRGPWLITLRRDGAAWRVTGRTNALTP